MRAYVVSFETRDVIGRIVEQVDGIYLSREAARARARAINTDPVSYVNMVAWTSDFEFESPAQPGKPGTQRPRLNAT